MLLPGGGRSSGSPHATWLPLIGGGCWWPLVTTQKWLMSWLPTQPSPTAFLWENGRRRAEAPHYSLARVEFLALHSTFADIGGIEPQFFCAVCQNFCLARLLFFLVLCLKRSCFSWISLCVCPLVFSVVSFFTIYDILGKNKTQGTHHCLVPWVWSSLASLPVSFRFSQALYVCNIYFYICPGFLVVLSRRYREKYVYSTLLKQRSHFL